MDGSQVKRILAVAACLILVTSGGCADFFSAPSWMPFAKRSSPSIPGITPPDERIAELKKIATRAGSKTPQQKQETVIQLATAIRGEGDPSIRAEIVRTLGFYPGDVADGVLHAAVGDPSTDVQQAACEAWGRRGNGQAALVLQRVVEDEEAYSQVRIGAARALGRIKDQSAVHALGSALEDRNPALQYQAVLSLRELTGEDLGNDVNRWRQYVRGELPGSGGSSIAGRGRGVF